MVYVYVRVCQGVGEKRRRKPAWELAAFGGNAAQKLKLRRVISSIPECSGSRERRGGKVGRGGSTAAQRQEGGWAVIFAFRSSRLSCHKHTHAHN